MNNTITFDQDFVNQLVRQSVEETVMRAVNELPQDAQWLEKLEKQVSIAMIQRTSATLSSIDINSIIKERVDENVVKFKRELLSGFSSAGIDDQATNCQLTVMDGHVVVENRLTVKQVEAVDTVTTRDLVVKGSINVDNESWQTLANSITAKTIEQMDKTWRDKLVDQVKHSIKDTGIEFDTVKLGTEYLVRDGRLSNSIKESNLSSVGVLRDLSVEGDVHVGSVLTATRNRVGINTREPDAALCVWDEEVQITVNKFKQQEAFIGTGRSQALNIGVNRDPQITIGTDGITAVKKLRVAQWRMGHATEVPNWSGVKGDIMFNANQSETNPVFAWVCLGAYKWKTLKVV